MNLIFSADDNWGIGCDNALLFRAKGDLAFFRRMTTGKTVIMGRMTLASLPGGKPLPNRTNIVLTASGTVTADGVICCRSLPELFEKIRGANPDDLFVIGGETVYRALLPYCGTAYVTRFYASVQADRVMPDFDRLAGWQLVEQSGEMREDGLCYRFLTYRQENPAAF